MTAGSLVLFSLVLSFPLMESSISMIEAAEWLAVSSDLNRVLDVIEADATLKILAGASYTLNLGSSSFEKFASEYRGNCGNPMESYARKHNITSDTSCVWNFLQTASQDSAFSFGVPFDREIFPDCGTWLTQGNNAFDHFIIGMWAIYENKAEIIRKLGTEDCENLKL